MLSGTISSPRSLSEVCEIYSQRAQAGLPFEIQKSFSTLLVIVPPIRYSMS